MTTTQEWDQGSYRYLPGVFQYSAGVAASPGYMIERVCFSTALPLTSGFRRIADTLINSNRPLTALCACELRSPEPFSEQDFKIFNEKYVAILREWGLSDGKVNPVARSNVCPEIGAPTQTSVHAFAYTREANGEGPSFVVAGSGEAPEGKENYKDHIVALGDISASGMRTKARWVLGELERRMSALGVEWNSTTAVQVYTVHDIHSVLVDEIVSRGAARHGITWHFDRPPVVGLEYEMDCRGVQAERFISSGSH